MNLNNLLKMSKPWRSSSNFHSQHHPFPPLPELPYPASLPEFPVDPDFPVMVKAFYNVTLPLRYSFNFNGGEADAKSKWRYMQMIVAYICKEGLCTLKFRM